MGHRDAPGATSRDRFPVGIAILMVMALASIGVIIWGVRGSKPAAIETLDRPDVQLVAVKRGALTEHAEALLICEKYAGQTEIKRPDPTKLARWLAARRLGDLWTSGQLGGVRW